MNRQFVSLQVKELIESYTGKRLCDEDDNKLIGQEIGVTGGDSVQLLDELESMFSISLEPLVQQHAFVMRPGILRRLLGLSGPRLSDVALGELIDFIALRAD